MSRHIAVMSWGIDSRVAKSMIFDSVEESDAHIATFIERFPDAFSHPMLEGQPSDWVVDPATNTVTFSLKPPKPRRFITLVDFEARFTTAEWNKATDFVYLVDTTTGKPKNRALIQGLARATRINNTAGTSRRERCRFTARSGVTGAESTGTTGAGWLVLSGRCSFIASPGPPMPD